MNGIIQETILGIEELIRGFRCVLYQSVARSEKIVIAAVFTDSENIIQGHVFVFVSRHRFQAIRRFVIAEYPISFIAKQQVGFILRINSKEIVRSQFAVIDDVTLRIHNHRIVRCSGNTSFHHSHADTRQPQFGICCFVNVMDVFKIFVTDPYWYTLDTFFPI